MALMQSWRDSGSRMMFKYLDSARGNQKKQETMMLVLTLILPCKRGGDFTVYAEILSVF